MGRTDCRKTCCICGLVSKKKLSQKELKAAWRPSESYEKHFVDCFGVRSQGRSGDLCSTCRTLITKHKNNKDNRYPHIVDSKLTISAESATLSDISNLINKPVHGEGTESTSSTCNTCNKCNSHECKCNHHDQSSSTPSQPAPPASPEKKRLRDESPPPHRRVRTKSERVSSSPKVSKELVLFLGHHLPGNIVAYIMLFLSVTDIINLALNFMVPDVVKKLQNFVNVSEYGPLTQPQKSMLGKLIDNRENNLDQNGCIVIPRAGSGGKPRRFMRIRKVQVGSRDAGKRTKNQRSQVMERVEKIVSTPVMNTQDSIHCQRVNNIERDKEGYAAAAEEAGLRIVKKFTRETVKSLRSVMTLRMWRMLKRVFHDEVGWDVFGSVGSLQNELKDIELEYECGTVTSSTGDLVHFVRVKDIQQVVCQLVNDLRTANQLVYLNNLDEDCLWLHVATDKGGKSTKMILQVINQSRRHSMDFAKLIGYFEGKDDRWNMELIFGPVYKALQQCVADIANLNLQRPLHEQMPPVCQDPNNCDGEYTNNFHNFFFFNNFPSSTNLWFKLFFFTVSAVKIQGGKQGDLDFPHLCKLSLFKNFRMR